MKGLTMITCPHCGKETPIAALCRNCGKELELQQGLEVHYRDFKGSEMLDIKMSPHSRQETIQSPENAKEENENKPRSENKRTGRKAVSVFWVSAAIILSVLAWYFLLRFFLNP